MITALVIFQIKDLLRLISQYLEFEGKVSLGKVSDENLLKFFNFNVDFDTIINISDNWFDMRSDYWVDMTCAIPKTITLWTDDLKSSNYLNVCHLAHRKLAYFSEELEIFGNKRVKSRSIDTFIFHQNKELMLKEYNNLFERSINCIYTRKIIELIESYEYIIVLNDKEKDRIFKDIVNIFKFLFHFYDETLLSNVDITKFCERCAKFGHSNISTECFMYDKSYAKKNANLYTEFDIEITEISEEIKKEIFLKAKESFKTFEAQQNALDVTEIKLQVNKRLEKKLLYINFDSKKSYNAIKYDFIDQNTLL